MSEALRLIDHDFHFLNHDDSDEFREHIDVLHCHPVLADFITQVKAGDKVFLKTREDGSAYFKYNEQELEITIAIYRESGMVRFFFDFDDDEFTFTKNIWSKEKYNHDLQYLSDEDDVYPVVCEKCGCLMRCSRERWEKNKATQYRMKCTNDECKAILSTPEFVEHIKTKNINKLKTSIAKTIEHEFGVYSKILGEEEAAKWFEENKNDLLSDLIKEKCDECGGDRKPAFVLINEKHKHLIVACSQCFGSLRTGGTYISSKLL